MICHDRLGTEQKSGIWKHRKLVRTAWWLDSTPICSLLLLWRCSRNRNSGTRAMILVESTTTEVERRVVDRPTLLPLLMPDRSRNTTQPTDGFSLLLVRGVLGKSSTFGYRKMHALLLHPHQSIRQLPYAAWETPTLSPLHSRCRATERTGFFPSVSGFPVWISNTISTRSPCDSNTRVRSHPRKSVHFVLSLP